MSAPTWAEYVEARGRVLDDAQAKLDDKAYARLMSLERPLTEREAQQLAALLTRRKARQRP